MQTKSSLAYKRTQVNPCWQIAPSSHKMFSGLWSTRCPREDTRCTFYAPQSRWCSSDIGWEEFPVVLTAHKMFHNPFADKKPKMLQKEDCNHADFLKKLDMKTSNAWHDDPYKDVPAWLTENCEWIKPKTFYHQAMQKNSDWSPAFQCINASVKCLIIWCHYYLGWKQVTLKFQFITMEA